jgi:hypothetical protein
MSEAQAWAETHNDELHSVLDNRGASQMMHAFVNVRVDHRHSVVEELHKWYDPQEERPFEEAVDTARRLGGGFFQKVWEGDVLEAFKHADSNNQKVIAEAYAKDYLLGQCDNQMERNIVNERWPY